MLHWIIQNLTGICLMLVYWGGQLTQAKYRRPYLASFQIGVDHVSYGSEPHEIEA